MPSPYPGSGRERRRFLLTAAGLSLAGIRQALALPATPRQTAGPFYPVKLPLDDDADLTRVSGVAEPALGQHTELTGRIVDVNGSPLDDTRIEIWQCDANGRYRHPRERGEAPLDPGFQGHGRALTDGGGLYRFRTIRPVSYPGRTPHIHVAVFPAGEKPFVTQLYIRGEARNEGDFLFQALRPEQQERVQAEFLPRPGKSLTAAAYQAHFEIVLGGVTPGQG